MDADAWNARYEETPLLWSSAPNRFVEEELADLEPGSVLDVACGEGRNAIWLAEKGWDVTGVDFSSVALAKARRLALDRGVDVEWMEADILNWEPEGTFDLVLVAYIHLPGDSRRNLMRKTVSWVGPGGRLFLVGHDLATVGVSGPPDPGLLWDPERARQAVMPLVVDWVERRPRPTDTAAIAQDTVLMAHRPEE